MKLHLKIKILSLAAEARIIREQEQRLCRIARRLRLKQKPTTNIELAHDSIRDHRKFDIRNEQRATLIAYGFLRGRDYKAIEIKADTSPDWERAKALALKYGGQPAKSQIDGWITSAKEHLAST
jgi:hypothetical protein